MSFKKRKKYKKNLVKAEIHRTMETSPPEATAIDTDSRRAHSLGNTSVSVREKAWVGSKRGTRVG